MQVEGGAFCGGFGLFPGLSGVNPGGEDNAGQWWTGKRGGIGGFQGGWRLDFGGMLSGLCPW